MYPPPNWLRLFFQPNLFPYKYRNILTPSHTSYLPAYEDGTQRSETLAFTTDADESPRNIQQIDKHIYFKTVTHFLRLTIFKDER
jgi:hypothetical protein